MWPGLPLLAALPPRIWLRRADLNRQPSGYEPDDLPLVHSAEVLVVVADFDHAAVELQLRIGAQGVENGFSLFVSFAELVVG